MPRPDGTLSPEQRREADVNIEFQSAEGHRLVARGALQPCSGTLEIAPEHLDPFVALLSMCNALRRDRLPDRRVVIRFDFTGHSRGEHYWLLIELGDAEICKTYPGVEDLS